MRAILPIILIVAFALVSFALIVAISVGLGWVLTRILPFSLFEGTVVSMIAAVATLALWRTIFGVVPPWDVPEEEEEEDIPESRFWKSQAEKTWENWFRYVLANAVYEDLLEELTWGEDTSDQAVQELSIRLADAAVTGLKGMSPRTRRLRVTHGMLKHELARMGAQVYPDEMLEVAARAVNARLTYWEDDVRQVIGERAWDELVVGG